MMTSATLVVRVAESPRQAEGARLLVPLPPELEGQHLRSICVAGAIETEQLVSDGAQKALLAVPDKQGSPCVTYEVTLGPTGIPTAPFRHVDAPRLPGHLEARIRELLEGATSQAARERRIIDFASERLAYGPRAQETIASQLSCSLGEGKGNCIDINRFLVSALTSGGVPTTYFAGYYFPPGAPTAIADGMHCWIETEVDGSPHFWDVPYSLKYGFRPVPEGSSHLGGAYVAMSRGMETVFHIEGTAYAIEYLAQPVWLHPDGGLSTAHVVCEANLAAKADTAVDRGQALSPERRSSLF